MQMRRAWGRRQVLAAALGAPGLEAIGASAPAEVLRTPSPDSFSAHPGYFLDLLRLAWQKTARAGEPALRLEHADPDLPRERLRYLLAQGRIDVLWSTTTPEREARFLAVRQTLLRGLNEHRVLLVRRADLPRFQGLQSLEALRGLRAGLGEHWSDNGPFRANGFSVTTAAQYEALFRMLAAGRFDFIPRTLFEVGEDLQRFATLGLASVPDLLLSYAQPYYFFVAPQRPEVAQRLQRGLALAQHDGSLPARFMAEPALRNAWERLVALKATRLVLRPA